MVELEEVDGYQQFDIVIGNPPWGAGVNPKAIEYLKTDPRFAETIDVNLANSFRAFYSYRNAISTTRWLPLLWPFI